MLKISHEGYFICNILQFIYDYLSSKSEIIVKTTYKPKVSCNYYEK